MNDRNTGTSLLRTKLHRPRVGENHLHRQHLLDRLDRYVRRPLTHVSAPAGYGKSTLLSCWIEASGIPSAWVSLDEKDNDLRLFLAYLLEAVQTLFPGSVQKTEALLDIPNLPPVTILAHSLINELDGIDRTFVLVLDDYHTISAKDVHGLVGELLHHPAAALHLVLSTRLDPPLPLVRLRARKKMGEIRVLDLRFSQEEIAAYLKVHGASVEDDILSLLTERSEGWVTGLHLLMLSLEHQTDPGRVLREMPSENRNVINYLIDEVLANQPEEIQDYMLATAILNRFCAPLCDAVCITGSPTLECKMGGRGFLKWLEKSDLFVIPLDEHGRWFRYHHIFQKLLLNRLRNRLNGEDITALYVRASRWFAENNLIDEALQYALAAGDLAAAAQLVEQNRHIPLNTEKEHILQRWLSLLPDEIVRQRPLLLLAKAWVLNFEFELRAIPPLLEAIETLCGRESDQFPQEEIDLFHGILSFWEGRGEIAIALLHSALERTPPEHTGVVNEIIIYLAVSMQIAGQGRTGVQTFRRQFYEEVSEGPRKIRLLGAIAFIHMLSGELFEAEKAIRQMEDMANRTENVHVKAWSSYLQGIVHFQWNNLEAAGHHFSQALKNKFILDAGADMDSCAGLIFSYQGMQQPDKAKATMNRMMAFAQESGRADSLARAHSAEARLSLLQGEIESAVRILETTDFSSDSGTMLFWLDVPRITQCRVMIDPKSGSALSAAADKIREYLQFSRATHNTPQTIELLLLQTRVYQKQGRVDEALAVLEQAVALGRRGGYIRPFVNMGTEMADLLTRILKRGKAVHYIGRILKAFDAAEKSVGEDEPASRSGSPPEIQNQALPEPLSRREFDVLSLLGQRLRNKEIADRLFVSGETVKKHVSNIFRKLEAQSRQEAVVKAYKLGLLRQNTGDR